MRLGELEGELFVLIVIFPRASGGKVERRESRMLENVNIFNKKSKDFLHFLLLSSSVVLENLLFAL